MWQGVCSVPVHELSVKFQADKVTDFRVMAFTDKD